MDPLPTILMHAAAVFGNAAVGETAKRAINEAWDGVRRAIVRRFGDSHEAPKLLDQVRTAPQPPAAAQAAAQLAALPLESDPEIQKAIATLAAVLKSTGVTGITNVAGKVYGAQTNFGTIVNQIGSDD